MGIYKLNKTVARECPDLKLFAHVALSSFSGEAIAVDLSILVHKCYSTVLEDLVSRSDLLKEDVDVIKVQKRTVTAVLKDISRYFVANKIRPIIITEGKAPKLKTSHAHVIREAVRQKAITDLKILVSDIKNRGEKRGDLNEEFTKLVRLRCRDHRLPKGLYNKVIEAISEKGYPILQATGEAEELCTKLCIEGLVKAVYSKDTDNLVRRCPLLITKIIWDKDEEIQIAYTARYHPLIHQRMGLNYEQFIDYCIMMGCDYNKRVYRMTEDFIIYGLFSHGTIENLERFEEADYSCLNYKECRELLRERPLSECCNSLDELEIIFPDYKSDS